MAQFAYGTSYANWKGSYTHRPGVHIPTRNEESIVRVRVAPDYYLELSSSGIWCRFDGHRPPLV